ncbi:3-phosphoshikimate 1-carboxyvinyltransferase [Oenococcus sp. UCMA 14587]|nr:3-phosphoshikimate 1-carboxyvinyltransferase [Oenococcus sp. UCMA 14587]
MRILRSHLISGLHGRVKVPGDKSIAHRGIMLAAISRGKSRLDHFPFSLDCLTTIRAFSQLGVSSVVSSNKQVVTINGVGLDGLKQPSGPLNMGNSGTTTRLISGLLAGQTFSSSLIGDQSLSKRPMLRVSQPLNLMGGKINSLDGHLPIKINGQKLHAIDYQLPIASAQVKSALILAALYGSSTSTFVEKLPTRNHTEKMLAAFGAQINTAKDNLTITVSPRPHLHGQQFIIPGDFSSAAFFIVAATLVPNSTISLKDVGINSTRTGLLTVLKKMGGRFSLTGQTRTVEPRANLQVHSANLSPIKIGKTQIPGLIDELPLVALLMSRADGLSKITGAEELRLKEVDRIKVIVSEFKKLGIAISELADGFLIDGRQPWQIKNRHLDSHGDHRIAMTLAVAALLADCSQPITLEQADSVQISYPDFFQDLDQLSMNK